MTNFEQAAEDLVGAGRYADQHGWVPATSGNFSARLDGATVAITVSGVHKGRLQHGDFMRMSVDGRALDDKRPSAETLLHLQLYRHDPAIACVLHTHSVRSTVLSRLTPGDLIIEGMEVLKAFPGIATHQARVVVPVFPNDQDMERLSAQVAARLGEEGTAPGYLIAGHGLYTWGDSVRSALRHLEALEFLFECEIEMRRIRA